MNGTIRKYSTRQAQHYYSFRRALKFKCEKCKARCDGTIIIKKQILCGDCFEKHAMNYPPKLVPLDRENNRHPQKKSESKLKLLPFKSITQDSEIDEDPINSPQDESDPDTK